MARLQAYSRYAGFQQPAAWPLRTTAARQILPHLVWHLLGRRIMNITA